MPVMPSENEEEYFARQEIELRRKLVAERQAKIAKEKRDRAQKLHFMKCPKCGAQLEEIGFGDVRVDKCFSCEGMWLDSGELERLQGKDGGFMKKLLGAFR